MKSSVLAGSPWNDKSNTVGKVFLVMSGSLSFSILFDFCVVKITGKACI